MKKYDIHLNNTIIEIKERVSALRTIRDSLVRLMQEIAISPQKRGCLLLFDPNVSRGSLEKEFNNFKSALRSDVADRLFLGVVKNNEIKLFLPNIDNTDFELIKKMIEKSSASQARLPRPDLQAEVFRVILFYWVKRKGPITHKKLQEEVGCNYRTVAAVINKLGPAVERHSDRRINLKYFPKNAWTQFLATSEKSRATMKYKDNSNQPRSPESLARRLQRLKRSDLAIGGVIGAKEYNHELDIVGTPRLDVCVHAPTNQCDLSFVQKLDPALKHIHDPNIPAQLALHFIRRKNPFFKEKSNFLIADPVECLIDLYETRLDLQASEFEAFLIKKRERSNG